jgi:RND family efflux transporter MFP subunit
MRIKKIVIILLALAAIIAIYKMVPSHSGETANKEEARTAAVALVKRENLASQITLSAEFRPFEETDLHAKVAGYLKDISVDIGDQVKAGQVIATLDINELKSDFNRAQADYHNAKLDYDRISEVVKRKPGLLAQADVDKAQATYEMAKANMEHAKTFFDYATITVPFDGVITKRYVDPGALIQASTNSSTQTLPLVHVADNTRLRLDFPVPEAAVPQIHVGTPVQVTVQATGQAILAKVARSTGKIDSATRTMETEVDIENKDLRITPGMYASVVIDLEQKDGVLTLPVQAVVPGDKPNVWLVNKQNEVEERPITLGLQTANKVEILKGVNEGDQALFGSRGSLSIGMKVMPKPVTDKPTGKGA